MFLALCTLWLITLVVFGLSKCTPTNAVEVYLSQKTTHSVAQEGYSAEEYQNAAVRLGLHTPAFYLTVQPSYYPDQFYAIYPPQRRASLAHWLDQTKHAESAEHWLQAREVLQVDTTLQLDSATHYQFAQCLDALKRATTAQSVVEIGEKLQNLSAQHIQIQASIAPILAEIHALQRATERSARILVWPNLRWNGLQNQYHAWLSALLRFDFGTSFKYQRSVASIVSSRLKRTSAIGLLSTLLAIGIAIPLAVITAGRNRNRPLHDSRLIKLGLFTYAIPVAWLSSMLILVFATPWLHLQILPFDCSQDSSPDLISWLKASWKCLVLPIICMSIHLGAVLYLQMRSALFEVFQKDFIRTAVLKGLPDNQILWRHAFPNAAFPLITTLGGLLLYIISGSVIVEYSFNLRGMGSELIDAFQYHDYPVLFALLLIYAVAVVIGNLVSDILYAWLDPRVEF